MTTLFMFPNLSQWTLRAVDWIVVWNWQSRDSMIGAGALAWETAEQIPFASIRVRADNGKVRAGTDILVSHTSWNYDRVSGIHLDVTAMLAADSQGRSTTIDSQRFMRCAVIMRERINAVSPRVSPVVLRKELFNNGSAILRFRCECLPINQQRQVAVWENAVVLKTEPLRQDEFLLFNCGMDLHM